MPLPAIHEQKDLQAPLQRGVLLELGRVDLVELADEIELLALIGHPHELIVQILDDLLRIGLLRVDHGPLFDCRGGTTTGSQWSWRASRRPYAARQSRACSGSPCRA